MGYSLNARRKWPLKLAITLFSLVFISTSVVLGQKRAKHTVFLIGDAGAVQSGDANISELERQAKEVGKSATILYLGDNLYPSGLDPDEGKAREKGEEILRAEFGFIKGFAGRAFAIPGNHDWKNGGKKGREYVLSQQKFLQEITGREDIFQPLDGCPGPVEIPLGEDLLLVIVDTQWWLHPWRETEEKAGDCEVKTEEDYLLALNDVIVRHPNKRIVVAGHHPVITYGEHGGFFPAKTYFFPLTDVADWMYVPLPVVGALYPLYRKSGFSYQDTSNPANRHLRDGMQEIFQAHPDLVYVSGHEHSLQYCYRNGVHYMVSGSGSKHTPVRQGKYSEFAKSEVGFSRIDYHEDGGIFATYFSAKGDTLYHRKLAHKPYVPAPTIKEFNTQDLRDSLITVKASGQYKAGKSKKFFLGENYRDAWETPIEVPLLDLGKEKGGLKILKRGGGQQTKSLRLEDSTGQQYVLRSVEKFPENAIPVVLRNTIAKDAVQDQISSDHPYAALVVAHLAEYAGIYHANPTLVFIPDDPRLGPYRGAFGNTLCLFEERPHGDESHISSFGRTKKVYSTPKVVEKLLEDNDNQIDYRFAVRSRLFDMLIADWDRHDDQWRWASFKKGKGKLFRPIPRDRDHAFFVNEGLFPKIASRRWLLPKLEGFNEDIRSVPWFNFNARYFDRTFLVGASESDWIAEAEELQSSLTDEKIRQAVLTWPDTLFKQHGEEVIRKLISRRDKLQRYAKEHFRNLAKSVDVTGSEKNELFLVERRENGDLKVTVKKISKKGNIKQTLFEREFKKGETHEVRLYGISGDDVFKVTGTSKDGIKVRIIGGKELTKVEDETKGPKTKKVLVYDQPKRLELEKGKSVGLRLSHKPEVNDYDRYAFKFNQAFPLATAGYNPDDGLFLGGGAIIETHSFRKEPFNTKHTILAAVSLKGSAAWVKYRLEKTKLIGSLDGLFDARWDVPSYRSNFYGLGNNTEKHEDRDYYVLNYQRLQAHALLRKRYGEKQALYFGPSMIGTKIPDNSKTRHRYVSDYPENGLTESEVLDPHFYWGGFIRYEADTRDQPSFPLKGTHLNLVSETYKGIETSDVFSRIQGDLSLYMTTRLPRPLTLALRFGGAHNFGDYDFLQSNKLGGSHSLRGFRKDRFYGRTAAFNNTELRLNVREFDNYLLNGSWGIFAYNDIGRVWEKGEDSKRWHNSTGGGIFIAPFSMLSLTASVGVSNESTQFLFDFGFNF
ncbi:hypothetical protein FUAX_43150 (plasmid) [Fulvitalea axinellae]|uniref:Calcineurin-like phosphoesterase n=1 Tax=Fulvitalea axinellae TaxID=1182444 RepID=A0AAU9CV27_9BACT|nr:hypothetical protein FUAX_43150 [Fulvitalea axinellae]